MNDNDLLVLKNVLNDKEGFELIQMLLRKFCAFDRGIDFKNSEKEILRTVAKREQGLWLLDSCFKADKKKYMEILSEQFKEV